MTNILVAFKNILENPINDVTSHYEGSNRINGVGDALEAYVKDVFANTLEVKDDNKKNEIYEGLFSYIGNKNNPPDLMIRGGDAIEVKKIQSLRSAIALNSSYPKDKVYSDSLMITSACRDCEEWKEKDLYYTVGVIDDKKLKTLWFIQGACYSANKEVYEKIKNNIKDSLLELSDIEFVKTNEIAKVKKVDPLGITDLRVRGMWHIENPIKVYDYVTSIDTNDSFSVNLILLKDKYEQYPEVDREYLENSNKESFSLEDIKIKSPNNPAELLEAKLITYKI